MDEREQFEAYLAKMGYVDDGFIVKALEHCWKAAHAHYAEKIEDAYDRGIMKGVRIGREEIVLPENAVEVMARGLADNQPMGLFKDWTEYVAEATICLEALKSAMEKA